MRTGKNLNHCLSLSLLRDPVRGLPSGLLEMLNTEQRLCVTQRNEIGGGREKKVCIVQSNIFLVTVLYFIKAKLLH